MGIDLTFESLIPPQGSKLNEMDSSVRVIQYDCRLRDFNYLEEEREIERS